MVVVLPQFRLRIVDVTKHCSDEFKALAGKVKQVFIFDANRHVHCCEITPSYEMEPLYLTAKNYHDDEKLNDKLGEMLMENNAEDAEYHHVHNVNLDNCRILDNVTETQWNEFLENSDGTTEEERYDNAHRKMMQEMLERFRANCPV